MKKYLGFTLLSFILSCSSNITNKPIEPKPNNIQQENADERKIYDINSEYLLEKTNHINNCSIFTFKDIFISNSDDGVVLTESKHIHFDKNYMITDVKNSIENYNPDYPLRSMMYYDSKQYMLDNNLDGYIYAKTIYDVMPTDYSKIVKIQDGQISNQQSSLDLEINDFTKEKLFLDTDKNRFYFSIYNGLQRSLKLYFYENMKLVREEVLEPNIPIVVNGTMYPDFFMNNKKEGLISYEKQLTSLLYENNQTHIFFKKISDFKLTESFQMTANFPMILTDMYFDDNGNGITFYNDRKGNIYSKKIINYKPEEFDNLESSMIDNTAKNNKNLFTFSLNESGNGLLAWSDSENNIYTKSVKNYNVLGNPTKISTNNLDKLNLHLKINSKNEALIIWNESNPNWVRPSNAVLLGYKMMNQKDYCNELIIKKINY